MLSEVEASMNAPEFGSRVGLTRADITTLRVDAIVNAKERIIVWAVEASSATRNDAAPPLALGKLSGPVLSGTPNFQGDVHKIGCKGWVW